MGAAAFRMVTAAILLAAVAAAQSQPVRTDYKAVRFAEVAALVPKLADLARWCGESQLARERDRINAVVVELDADHERARAALQYRKQKDGTWTRPADWKEAKNSSERLLPELAKRRSELVDPVLSRLLDALDREKASMEASTRAVWLAELARIGPDNARIRDLAGEKLYKGQWVLVETATAAERHVEAVALAKVCVDGEKKIADGKPDEFESTLPLKWTAVRQGPFARIAATVPPAQVDKALRQFDGAWVLAHKLLGAEPAANIRFTVVLLANSVQATTFLKTHPETPDGDRGRPLLDYTLTKAGVVVNGCETEGERAHCGVFRATSLACQEIMLADPPPWAIEGVGLHVTQLVLGRREPIYGSVNQRSAGDQQLFQALAKPGADWLSIAAQRIKDGKAPKLDQVMTVGLFQMTPPDSLFAAAFAAYLLEGRPADAARFFRVSTGSGSPQDIATEGAGMPLPELESRFHRWIQETVSLRAGK